MEVGKRNKNEITRRRRKTRMNRRTCGKKVYNCASPARTSRRSLSDGRVCYICFGLFYSFSISLSGGCRVCMPSLFFSSFHLLVNDDLTLCTSRTSTFHVPQALKQGFSNIFSIFGNKVADARDSISLVRYSLENGCLNS